MQSSADLPLWFGLSSIILLVLANGFFVAAEFSLVAVRRSRVDELIEQGHPRAPVLKRAVDHLDAYLAATQLGITMSSLALGWIGEPALAHLLDPLFALLPEPIRFVSAHAFAVALAFAIITALHIVLGELAPKSLALQRSEATALATVRPLEWYLVLFRPAILFLNDVGNRLLALFGLRPAEGEGGIHSVKELEMLVAESGEAGVLGREAESIVKRAFEFDDFDARQVMVPRTRLVAVPLGTPAREALDLAVRHRHERLPVQRESLDDIVGMVHIVDLVRACRKETPPPLERVMKPVFAAPETIQADTLLARMRRERAHLAILVDEYGGTAGLVTMADLVERLIGGIGAPAAGDGTARAAPAGPDVPATLDGAELVCDVNDRFDLELDEDVADTIGGFVFAGIGRLPAAGDAYPVAGGRFEVLAMDGLRIAALRFEPSPEAAPGDDPAPPPGPPADPAAGPPPPGAAPPVS